VTTAPLPKPPQKFVETDKLREGQLSQSALQYMALVDGLLKGGSLLTQAVTDTLYEAIGLLHGINLQAASYVLVLADQGVTVEMNAAGANTLTVPSGVYPVKAWLNVVQVGAGITTITPGVGVTLHARNGLKTSGQWAMATGYQRALNEWIFGGALTP
jgi:hypothetical protein